MAHGPNILNPAQFSFTPCSPTRGIAAPTPWARLSVSRACEVVASAWTRGRESPIHSSPSLPGGPFWPGSPTSPRPRGPSPSPVMAGFPQLPRPRTLRGWPTCAESRSIKHGHRPLLTLEFAVHHFARKSSPPLLLSLRTVSERNPPSLPNRCRRRARIGAPRLGALPRLRGAIGDLRRGGEDHRLAGDFSPDSLHRRGTACHRGRTPMLPPSGENPPLCLRLRFLVV
jgi:hypothetical protein